MCANATTIREIMLAAEELNMVDSGEYVFFNIELFQRWANIDTVLHQFVTSKGLKPLNKSIWPTKLKAIRDTTLINYFNEIILS